MAIIKFIAVFKKLISSKLALPLFLVLLVVQIGILTTRSSSNKTSSKSPTVSSRLSQDLNKNNRQDILGSNYRGPEIYISGYDKGFSSGGVIALASTDEPAVHIGGYNISGNAEISLYQTNDDALLDYLTHDKDGKQTKKTPDESKIHFVTTINKDINTATDEGSKVSLPLSDKGIWYLKMKLSSVTADAFIVRSNIGTLVKEGDNQYLFWGQDFKTKKSVSQGIVILYNLQDGRKELERSPFDADGVAKAKLTKDADIAMVAQNDDRAIIPVNLRYLNLPYNGSDYGLFQEKASKTKYFIFTDRPLYKPSDTIFFKAVLRDDDDARYSIPNAQAVVKIYPGYDDKDSIFQKSYSISTDGTISGEFTLPETAKVGGYNLSVNIPNRPKVNSYWDWDYTSTASFDVEFFRKPEFSIEVTTPKTEIVAGEKTSFKISGAYFSGQPLAGQSVKYTVYSSDFYEYQYLTDQQRISQTISNDYRYDYWYGNNKAMEGTATLDKNGQVEISLDTILPFAKGRSQVFSIEATIQDGSQNPSFSRRNVLVYAGEFGIFRKDWVFGTKVNTPFSLPLALVSYRGNSNLAAIDLTAKVHRETWNSYPDPNQKYPAWRKEEENLSPITTRTDAQGNATLNFTPVKTGSYTITVEGKDARQNLISKVFYAYISANDYPYYNPQGDNNLTVATDKQKYQPEDTARLTFYSYVPDRDIFLSLERGRVNRYQVVHLSGKTGFVDLPLVSTDIPNIYAKAESFDDTSLNSGQIDISVSSESKKLVVNLTPNSKTYGPGETVNLNVATSDTAGNPVSADLAVWAVDKAIFELSDTKLGNIFDTFWQERGDSTQEAHSLQGILVFQGGGRGGCFFSGTKILMADGALKNIEDVRVGEFVLTRETPLSQKLVKARVIKTESTQESGHLIVNGSLKVTANHYLWVNNNWKEAGSVQIGDSLLDSQGKNITVRSVEWQAGKVNVYNLDIDRYHTYFADGVLVHNQKGMLRQSFKDTAYWNPSVHTDSSGRSQVSFKLPDNLTTWALAAVAATSDTRVGQSTNEIVVSKDIIVRPILPNLLRVGDQAVLSALVQNFTNSDQTLNVGLKFDSGNVDTPNYPGVIVKASEIKQFFWKVGVTSEKDNAKFVFSAQSRDNKNLGDIVTQTISTRPFVFEEKTAQTGTDNFGFAANLSPDANKAKSKIILSLAPTIIGTLPAAMNYLIQYPFGCVEQTTSRFVPAVIAKANPDLFALALSKKDIDDILQKGVSRLTSQQQSDGGWTWWFSGSSDPFITSYVVEYLLLAKQQGVSVDDSVFSQAKTYLQNNQYYDDREKSTKQDKPEDSIAKNYGLTLLGAKDKLKPVANLDSLSPDILALAVMTNYLNGNKDSQSNGLSKLVALAQTQGDTAFWEAGHKLNFGSRDASTALAIRAIILAGGDRNLAAKGAKYLTRNRRSDYWSNTFATAQVVRALVDLSKSGNELVPNYSYSVLIDQKPVASGTVTSAKQYIKDIVVPASSIKADGSTISVTKNGEGQLYSTLLIDQFHTDIAAKSVNHGLSITREYVNDKGEEYSLGVGDTVTVRLIVEGLKSTENYGVITDQLPAGIVPINENFKNEQYGQTAQNYYFNYGLSDQAITENGNVLSLYEVRPGIQRFTYRARVVSEGTFVVPPATVSLMYAPEISGRSSAETLKIDKEAQIVPGKKRTFPSALTPRYTLTANLKNIAVVVIIAVAVFILLLRSGLPSMVWKKLRQPKNES